MIIKDLREKILSHIKTLNWDRNELASTLEISNKSLQRLLDTEDIKKLEIFIRICELLEVTPNDLIGGLVNLDTIENLDSISHDSKLYNEGKIIPIELTMKDRSRYSVDVKAVISPVLGGVLHIPLATHYLHELTDIDLPRFGIDNKTKLYQLPFNIPSLGIRKGSYLYAVYVGNPNYPVVYYKATIIFDTGGFNLVGNLELIEVSDKKRISKLSLVERRQLQGILDNDKDNDDDTDNISEVYLFNPITEHTPTSIFPTHLVTNVWRIRALIEDSNIELYSHIESVQERILKLEEVIIELTNSIKNKEKKE